MTFTYVPDLDERQVEEAASQTFAIWSGGWSLEAHTQRQKEALRRAGPAILRYAGLFDETGLVASMKRYGLVVHAPGFGPVPALGIGAVFTRTDARGKGAAPQLLRTVMDDARANGCALALLYSEIDPAYYERLGFVQLEPIEHSAATNEFPDSGTLQVRLATPTDEPSIIEFHEASWDRSIVRIVRTPEHLRFFRWRNTADQAWILQQAGKDVGYVIAALHDGSRDDGVTVSARTLWVDEWAAVGIHQRHVFAAIRQIAEKQSAERVAGWLNPWDACPPFVGVVRKEPIAMVRALGGPISTVDPSRTFFGSLDHF